MSWLMIKLPNVKIFDTKLHYIYKISIFISKIINGYHLLNEMFNDVMWCSVGHVTTTAVILFNNIIWNVYCGEYSLTLRNANYVCMVTCWNVIIKKYVNIYQIKSIILFKIKCCDSTIIQQSNFAINQFNSTGNILSKFTFESSV